MVMTATPLFPETAKQSRFDELWKTWPNKQKKPLARAKYEAIIRDGTLKTRTFEKDSNSYVEIEISGTEDEIIAGAEAYMSTQIDRNTYKLKDGGRFIPMLSSWLNQGRWTDL